MTQNAAHLIRELPNLGRGQQASYGTVQVIAGTTQGTQRAASKELLLLSYNSHSFEICVCIKVTHYSVACLTSQLRRQLFSDWR